MRHSGRTRAPGFSHPSVGWVEVTLRELMSFSELQPMKDQIHGQLDHILMVLHSNIDSEQEMHASAVHGQSLRATPARTEVYLEQLVTDGYAMASVRNHPPGSHNKWNIYRITAKGQLFLHDKGYTGQHDKKQRARLWEWAKISAAVLNSILVLYLGYLKVRSGV